MVKTDISTDWDTKGKPGTHQDRHGPCQFRSSVCPGRHKQSQPILKGPCATSVEGLEAAQECISTDELKDLKKDVSSYMVAR